MQIATLLGLTLAATGVAAPTAYYLTIPTDDPLGDTLHDYGFLAIHPPSNLIQVGSLYFVDARVKTFTPICNADKADLQQAVMTSPSWDMKDYLETKGQFATGIKLDAGQLFDGDIGNSYDVQIRSSLTDVVLQEIPLGANQSIFVKLMEQPSCSQVAMQYIHASGYVCQGQRTLKATAEYKLDRNTQSKLKAHAKTDKVQDLVRAAVETQGDQSVVNKEGRLFAGEALEYGVSMNPMCLAPPNARFQRVLPQTTFGRIWNYVLFDIVEPMLPLTDDRVEVAQGTQPSGAATSSSTASVIPHGEEARQRRLEP